MASQPWRSCPNYWLDTRACSPLERTDVNALYDLIAARIAVGVLIQTWREQNNPRATASEQVASGLAEASAAALDALDSGGKELLTEEWLDAAGIEAISVRRGRVVSGDLIRRRHNALGANAELSYDQPLHLVRGEGVWVYTSDRGTPPRRLQ